MKNNPDIDLYWDERIRAVYTGLYFFKADGGMHELMPQIACYCRVSTTDQNLERQLESTSKFAQSEFDVGLADIEVFRDKSTGTNTKRSGIRS